MERLCKRGCTLDSERRRSAAIMWSLLAQFLSALVLWKCSLVPHGSDGWQNSSRSRMTRCSLYSSRVHQVEGWPSDTFFQADKPISQYWDLKHAGSLGLEASHISISLHHSVSKESLHVNIRRAMSPSDPCRFLDPKVEEDRFDVVRDGGVVSNTPSSRGRVTEKTRFGPPREASITILI